MPKRPNNSLSCGICALNVVLYMVAEITLTHPKSDGMASGKASAEAECTAVLQPMIAFDTIRQKMEQDMTTFFGCALKSFADTVLK